MENLRKIEEIKAEYLESLSANLAGHKDDYDHMQTGSKCLARIRRAAKCSRAEAWAILLPE